MWVVTQPETPETDLLWMGPVYALLIGLWSLPNLLLGALESSMSKRAVLLRLTPILFFANIFSSNPVEPDWILARYIGCTRGVRYSPMTRWR